MNIDIFKNKYFFLRHGQNNHQVEHKDIIYFWPDGNPPYHLTELGKEESKLAGEKLKKDNINYIFSSDILRCRETAKIAAQIIGYDIDKIIYDTRLRDLNWGDFGGKTKEEYWGFYGNDRMNAFDKTIPGGESWNQCKERAVKLFNEIEEEFQNQSILIVSHGDTLWLLEGYIRGLNNKELLEKRSEIILGTGEVREIL
jgi:broad specificity phosphatase PhoE